MITLHDPLCSDVEYKGKKYALHPSFDRVIAAYKILEDERFTQSERVEIALSYLVEGKCPVDYGLLCCIFDSLQVLPKSGESNEEPDFDFDYDAPYIYAAFMQTYGIDLYEQSGILHWQKFVSLFTSLPANTRFLEIRQIRTRKVPASNAHNREEIEALMKAKAYYRLPSKHPEKGFNEGLKKIVMALRK